MNNIKDDTLRYWVQRATNAESQVEILQTALSAEPEQVEKDTDDYISRDQCKAYIRKLISEMQDGINFSNWYDTKITIGDVKYRVYNAGKDHIKIMSMDNEPGEAVVHSVVEIVRE